jgi:hypothetical protein
MQAWILSFFDRIRAHCLRFDKAERQQDREGRKDYRGKAFRTRPTAPPTSQVFIFVAFVPLLWDYSDL